jgi:hypothetical protein
MLWAGIHSRFPFEKTNLADWPHVTGPSQRSLRPATIMKRRTQRNAPKAKSQPDRKDLKIRCRGSSGIAEMGKNGWGYTFGDKC